MWTYLERSLPGRPLSAQHWKAIHSNRLAKQCYLIVVHAGKTHAPQFPSLLFHPSNTKLGRIGNSFFVEIQLPNEIVLMNVRSLVSRLKTSIIVKRFSYTMKNTIRVIRGQRLVAWQSRFHYFKLILMNSKSSHHSDILTALIGLYLIDCPTCIWGMFDVWRLKIIFKPLTSFLFLTMIWNALPCNLRGRNQNLSWKSRPE